MQLDWDDLLKYLPLAVNTSELPKLELKKLSIDSRNICPDSWYLPLVGERFDGHEFISDSLEKGALGFFYEEHYRNKIPKIADKCGIAVKNTAHLLDILGKIARSYFDGPIIGITGSNGKTTVKEMTASILSQEGKTLKTLGNKNNEIGVPLTLLKLEKSHKFAVIEMGARRGGDIKHLCSIAQPSIVCITNIGTAHLGVFGSKKELEKAKTEIFHEYTPKPIAICDLENKAVLTAAHNKSLKVTSYGPRGSEADYILKSSKKEDKGQTLVIETQEEELLVDLSCFHTYNSKNALLAVCLAKTAGAANSSIVEGLRSFSPPPGRFKIEKTKFGDLVDDCYNANPESLQGGLLTLRELYPSQEILLVLGDMLELGKGAERIHVNLIKNMKNLQPFRLLTVGELSKKIETDATSCSHFDSVDALLSFFRKNPLYFKVIYVKGSNSIGLNKFISYLKEE